jgi:hypothetical protein
MLAIFGADEGMLYEDSCTSPDLEKLNRKVSLRLLLIPSKPFHYYLVNLRELKRCGILQLYTLPRCQASHVSSHPRSSGLLQKSCRSESNWKLQRPLHSRIPTELRFYDHSVTKHILTYDKWDESENCYAGYAEPQLMCFFIERNYVFQD